MAIKLHQKEKEIKLGRLGKEETNTVHAQCDHATTMTNSKAIKKSGLPLYVASQVMLAQYGVDQQTYSYCCSSQSCTDTFLPLVTM